MSEGRHPIRIRVRDDLRRSRLTVLFRLLLLVPHLAWLSLWGVAAAVAVVVGWFAALARGRLPEGLHVFIAANLRYATHVWAYGFLLADPFPPFTGVEGVYPFDLEVDPPAGQPRWKTLFRIVLALPALLLDRVMIALLAAISFFAWFVCLALGRMPEGMRNLGAFCLRYQAQTQGYLGLVTERYPSLNVPAP